MPNPRFWIPYLFITIPLWPVDLLPYWAKVAISFGVTLAIPEKPFK